MQPEIYPSGTVRALLETDYVTPKTREVLQARLTPGGSQSPRFFDAQALATLRAACARLIPQTDRTQPVDLAGAIDTRLADGKGDGWRYNTMPPDGEAYLLGLRGLDETAQGRFSVKFALLDTGKRDEILTTVQRGEVAGGAWEKLPPGRFFEELLAELTECYYSDPITQEEIGYVGMADAHGWQAIGLNEREPREPEALGETHD